MARQAMIITANVSLILFASLAALWIAVSRVVPQRSVAIGRLIAVTVASDPQPPATCASIRQFFTPRQSFMAADTDGDGQVSAAEQQAWITKYLSTLQASVDGQQRPVVLERASPFSREQFLVSMRQAVSLTLRLDYDLKPAEEHRFKLVDGLNIVGYDEYYISYGDAPGVVVLVNTVSPPPGWPMAKTCWPTCGFCPTGANGTALIFSRSMSDGQRNPLTWVSHTV